MANQAAMYEIIYVYPDGTMKTRRVRGAPAAARLYTLRPQDGGARYVARYFPSKKHWRVFDLTKFTVRPMGPRTYIFPPPYLELPEKDAAVMAAVLLAS